NRILAGSAIGGLRETQEMLDFCAEKNVMPEIEVIRADQINEAWDRLVKGDVRYRFVIDMGTIDEAS
ncbi:MAG TPA: NAD(P)-dependent alcohol dehydrogenase, partial [Sphingomicrobium sp.]|nr:NAD(P)-dependent alcohol dehydrogenase [Sphingomicrobium sp.]